jgi:hypothetical protein
MVRVPIDELDAHGGDGTTRHPWLTRERESQVRGVLLGIALFVGLVVWVWHSFGAPAPQSPAFARKLRVVGIMTWLYALVQLVDMRFWHSGVAARRRLSLGIPDSLISPLFGQMLAWFGIVYYACTEDIRWYAGGIAALLLTLAAFPVRRER